MRDLIPWIGDRKTRDALDDYFSRDMLGAVLVGAAAGKVVEKTLGVLVLVVPLDLPDVLVLLVAWTAAFLLFLFTFAYWSRIEDAVGEVA